MSNESEEGFNKMLSELPAPTHEPVTCQHEDFAAFVAVARLEDIGRFACEVRVVCIHCREPFRFIGIQPGLSFTRPACSIDGLEAFLPIEAEGVKRLFGGATYEMPPKDSQH